MRRLLTALLCLGLFSLAGAQLDEPQPTCAPLTYVLQVQPGTDSQMQVSAALNSSKPLKIDSAKGTDSAKADVTAQVKPTGNTLNIQWKVTGDANKADTRTSWVTLQMGSGQTYTPVAVFRTDYYPGRQSLNFKFDAPPQQSVRCDAKSPKYDLTLGRASSGGRVTQFTLSVNGKFYALTTNEPADMGHGLHINLQPYLVHGVNHVKVLWQVLKQQGMADEVGAQLTRTTQGQTVVLAKTLVKGKQGDTGALTAKITVP
ncbi:hypothetical protein MF271_23840 (plasmid) [Deinococcus sp. KNUC1210]|uniref:hypothetical protein n=1 Tax=Deinococcus sp. KNUC1210 TaxID=2917691 RepID=UPI001EEFA230|nr:hypothetical protein [Deinococcus sp. KNUC1210]ULH17996.1 hypothetical protein MF271_23840 [Deinococcus sp. KNUC1210]